mmetsp:Transcript_25375/g.85056  ORF Transcript_25375/g.85056 Transcript_25375/m.85056 type:complete len:224 (+) Transcript_25375:53-724(+)
MAKLALPGLTQSGSLRVPDVLVQVEARLLGAPHPCGRGLEAASVLGFVPHAERRAGLRGIEHARLGEALLRLGVGRARSALVGLEGREVRLEAVLGEAVQRAVRARVLVDEPEELCHLRVRVVGPLARRDGLALADALPLRLPLPREVRARGEAHPEAHEVHALRELLHDPEHVEGPRHPLEGPELRAHKSPLEWVHLREAARAALGPPRAVGHEARAPEEVP